MPEPSEHLIIFQFARKMSRAESNVVVSNFFRFFFRAALAVPQTFDVGVRFV